MRYMFLIYNRELETVDASTDAATAVARHWAVMDEAKQKGVFCGAEPRF